MGAGRAGRSEGELASMRRCASARKREVNELHARREVFLLWAVVHKREEHLSLRQEAAVQAFSSRFGQRLLVAASAVLALPGLIRFF